MDPLAGQFERFRSQGDLQALAAVFDALAPRLLPVAMHLTGRPADAEDAVQQTFLLAIDKATVFDATQRLEPWLAGLLQNVVRNQRRHEGRRRTEPLPDCASEELGPLASAEREELVARLRLHVDALPAEEEHILRVHEALQAMAAVDERMARVVEMRYFGGMTDIEIGEALGVTDRTVRRDWEQAKLFLAEALK